MLCPEVWTFPSPKILTTENTDVDSESLKKIINMNCFYESITVTIPDEITFPSLVNLLTNDREYYEIRECPVSMFLEADFIDCFVKKGTLTCLSIGKPCLVGDCIAITPDGILTVHILDYIYQHLGIEGTKRPYNFYEIKVNLKEKINPKTKQGLKKLESLDFYLLWEPDDNTICPSSIAKYLYDQEIKISQKNIKLKQITPDIEEIPSIKDVPSNDIIEWIGMILHKGDMSPEHEFVSSYSIPESENPLKSTRLLLSHVEGFFPQSIINKICNFLLEYMQDREAENYWVSISMQTFEDSLWRWDYSRPSYFQRHDSSTTIFFSKDNIKAYSVGQIKFG